MNFQFRASLLHLSCRIWRNGSSLLWFPFWLLVTKFVQNCLGCLCWERSVRTAFSFQLLLLQWKAWSFNFQSRSYNRLCSYQPNRLLGFVEPQQIPKASAPDHLRLLICSLMVQVLARLLTSSFVILVGIFSISSVNTCVEMCPDLASLRHSLAPV